jgi:hypothetical protein
VLSGDSSGFEKYLVAFFALAAGILALVPRVKNYGEMAGQARGIASSYGQIGGPLFDSLSAIDAGSRNEEEIRAAVAVFEETKAKKDQLRYLPRGKRLKAAREAAVSRVEKMTKSNHQ